MKFEKCTFPITKIARVKDTKTGLLEREYSMDVVEGYSFGVSVPLEVQHRFWRCEENQEFFVYNNGRMWNVTCPITGACIISAPTRKDAIEKFENVEKEKYFVLLQRSDFEKIYKKQIDEIARYYKS